MIQKKFSTYVLSCMRSLCQFVLLLLMLVAVGCSSATYIKSTVNTNPIQRVAQQAINEWSVEQVDENTLHLRNVWPVHSFFALGYSASYVNLFYNPTAKELDLQYYFSSHQPFLLWFPFSIDAEPGFTGGALKPIMNSQIEDILTWSGATLASRRAGDRSDPFPTGKTPE